LVKNLNTWYWTMPGGGIKRGETPEDCIKRELKEELDLDIQNTEYELGEYTSQKEGKKDEIHVFVIKLNSKEFSKQWEIEDAKWFDLNNLPENMSHATMKRIKEYSDGEREIKKNW